MTIGAFFTCRTKPFDRGLNIDQVTDEVREAWRDVAQNHRPGVVPNHVVAEAFFPQDHKRFFDSVVSVGDWEHAPISPNTVFITTGPFGWTDKLVGHERPFFERFIELVRDKDPYAAVGVARLLLGGSTNPPALTFVEVADVDALFAHSPVPYNVLLETRLHPKVM